MTLRILIFCIMFFYSFSVKAMLEFGGAVNELLRNMQCPNSEAIRLGQRNTKVIYIFDCKEKVISEGIIECDDSGCVYIKE